MIDFSKKDYNYTLEQVMMMFKFVIKTMDVKEDELFRVGAEEKSLDLFEACVTTAKSQFDFEERLKDLSSIDKAFLMNKMFRESEILDFNFLPVVGARDALAEKLNTLFTLTVHDSIKKSIPPKACFKNLKTAVAQSIENTVLSFLAYLLKNGQTNTVSVFHNYLYMAKKVAEADNDTNLEGLSTVLAGSLIKAFECHGRFSKISQPQSSRIPVQNAVYETYFFSAVIERMTRLPCFAQPFPSQEDLHKTLYELNATFDYQADEFSKTLKNSFREPRLLVDQFSKMQLEDEKPSRSKKKPKRSKSDTRTKSHSLSSGSLNSYNPSQPLLWRSADLSTEDEDLKSTFTTSKHKKH